MAANLKIFPAALARSVSSAVAAAAVGSKAEAGCAAISSAIGSSYRVRVRNGASIVVDLIYQEALPVANGAIAVPAYSTLAALVDASISTGWVVRIGRADDSVYVEGSVGGPGSGRVFTLTANPDDNKGFAVGHLTLRFDAMIDGGRRWVPGHYLQATDAESRSGIAVSKANLIAGNANFAGIQVSVWWGQHEVTQGDYTGLYTQMDAIRAWARANDKRVWIRLFERSFHGESRPAPFPQYIRNTGDWYNLAMAQAAGYTGTENLYVPRVWRPGFVRERFMLWCEKVAEYVAGNPEFVMLSNEEWSFAGAWRFASQGLWSAADNDSLWIEFAQRMLARMGDAVLHCNTGWHSVGDQSVAYYQSKLAEIVATGLHVLGPTDLRKDNTNGTAFLATDFGQFMTNPPNGSPAGYRGQLGFCAQYEWPDYVSVEGPAEHLRWAVDDLGLHFIAWDPDRVIRFDPDNGNNPWIWSDALAAVNAAGGRINTARPSRIV